MPGVIIEPLAEKDDDYYIFDRFVIGLKELLQEQENGFSANVPD